MTQGVPPSEIERERTASGATPFTGLPVDLDLASVLHLGEIIAQRLHVKTQGWTDAQAILFLICLNFARGDCVDDLPILFFGKSLKENGSILTVLGSEQRQVVDLG